MTTLASTAEEIANAKSRRLDAAPVVAIVVLGLILRFVAISVRPFWYDEAFSVLFSEKGLAAMLEGTLTSEGGAAADVHPLGYYSLLSLWMRGIGQSPLAVRSLSVLIGTGLILMSYGLSRLLFGERIGRWTALFLALSPFQLHYAQEARMYVLLAFLLLAATGVFYKGQQTGLKRWWILFAFLAALSQYTHHLAFVYLLPLALTPVWIRDWTGVRPVFWSGLGALLLYAPWLIQLPAQFTKVSQGYWTVRPGVGRLVTVGMTYVTNLPVPRSMLGVGLFITMLVFAVAAWQTFLAVRSKAAGYRAGLWLAYLALAPVAVLFLVSQFWPVFIERALLPSGAVFLAWLAWALLSAPSPRAIRFSIVTVLFAGMLIGIYQHISYRGFPYADFKQLAQVAQNQAGTGVKVVHSNKLTALPTTYYDRSSDPSYVADPPGSGSDTLALPTQKVLGLFASSSVGEAVGASERVLFVIFSRAIDEYEGQGETLHPHLDWLEANFQRTGLEAWDDLLLYSYARK